jgi:hypothetical protein
MLVGGQDFCLDDAWIHLAYAKSLRLGDGLSYNPGDWETGFSSPLWVFFIALLPWGSSPVVAVKLFGGLCHAALAWGVASTVELLGRERSDVDPRWLAFAGAVMCALDPAFAFAATSGMEVSLAAALIVWTLYAALTDRTWWSAALGFAAVWARPEALLFIGAWTVLRWSVVRTPRTFAPLLAAGAAMLAWTAYCYAVSGYPFPNTYYAKRGARLDYGVFYFFLGYLPQHAWMFGVAGFVLCLRALVRPGEARRLMLAWLLASIAIAGTREIMPRVLFYCWRYFAILGAIPMIALVTALPVRRALQIAALAPIALATLWLLPAARELQHGQESDIHLVHTEPAQWLARTVPRGGRVLVEGAGASRFFIPRDVFVIDAIGLNLKSVVHASEWVARRCEALRHEPMYVSLPVWLYGEIDQILTLQKLREFVAPGYRIVLNPRPERVIAARVVEISPRVRKTCKMP